jgi:hypothetical protein
MKISYPIIIADKMRKILLRLSSASLNLNTIKANINVPKNSIASCVLNKIKVNKNSKKHRRLLRGPVNIYRHGHISE